MPENATNVRLTLLGIAAVLSLGAVAVLKPGVRGMSTVLLLMGAGLLVLALSYVVTNQSVDGTSPLLTLAVGLFVAALVSAVVRFLHVVRSIQTHRET